MTTDTERRGILLFTPQRLFGEALASPDLLRHSTFLERARLEQEHGREAASQFALTAYLVARLIDRLPLAASQDLAGYHWQLDALRRQVGTLAPDYPESAHLAGVVDMLPCSGHPSAGLRVALTAYAYFLEHEARLDEALAVLMLVAHCHGPSIPAAEFAAMALFTARLNRLLARWEAATACYAAAEEAGRVLGDHVAALRGQLGRGAVHRGQGNLPLAQAVAQAVIEEAGRLDLPEVQAMAYADWGVVLQQQGKRIPALEALYQAFLRTPDALQQMRTLGDIGIGLSEIGAYDEARLALEIVVNGQTSFLVGTNALLELMHLESLTGNRMAFERRRADAETLRPRMSPSMAVDFQFKAGSGLARFGQTGRAREWLTTGLRLAERHQLNSWYFRIEAALRGLTDAVVPDLPRPVEADETADDAVRSLGDRLRHYAARAAD